VDDECSSLQAVLQASLLRSAQSGWLLLGELRAIVASK
jgi:hypothetical protein